MKKSSKELIGGHSKEVDVYIFVNGVHEWSKAKNENDDSILVLRVLLAWRD